jgi:GGDEF domain-containing protein
VLDILVQLGGDEIAVRLPNVRNRAEIDEIAHRFERSLEEPYPRRDTSSTVRPASVTPLHSVDGSTKDDLL